jgi:hypothetical protein
MERIVARSPRSAARRKAVKVTVWVRSEVKAELRRVAEQDGLSVSATGAAFLEEALRQSLHVQHAVLLQPIIEQAIAKQMRAISTRLAWLLVRVAFDAGQTRSLVTNVLGRQPGMTPEVLKTILASSGKSAKGNLTRRTPQIAELIDAVEQWMVAEGGKHAPRADGNREGHVHAEPGRGQGDPPVHHPSAGARRPSAHPGAVRPRWRDDQAAGLRDDR